MLEIQELCVEAGSFSLNDVTVTVPSSSCHVILGPTGSGKSLLLESLIGLRKHKSGKIFLDGQEITQLPIEKRKLSYVPQDLALFPHMTVHENIFYPIRIRGPRHDHQNGIVEELVEYLGIQHLLNRSIKNLSGGERQRIALARAVASGSRYLILDEPLSALHESLKRQLWHVMKILQEHYELGMLTVTHDLEEAFFLADSISIVLEGRIRRQGPRESVYSSPVNLEVAEFLGIRNLFSSRTIARQDDSIIAYCDDLNMKLRLAGEDTGSFHKSGSLFFAGIRSQDVKVIMPTDLPPDTSNVIKGTIKNIFGTGALLTLVVSVADSFRSIEAVVLSSEMRKMSISTGNSVLIILPEECLFAVNPHS
ncbi:MAG: ATP-binding cassette domain-containing protein [Desulfomonilaceae bacterium]